MNLAEELRILKEQVQHSQVKDAIKENEAERQQREKADRIISEIPDKLKEAILQNKSFELVMPIKNGCGEGDVEFNYSVKPRGMAIIPEDLIGAAKIVWNWCLSQGLNIGLSLNGYPDGVFGIIVTL